MCGIIGIVSGQNVAPRLVDGLKRLEYRGYDSAGIAVATQGQLFRLRAEGKIVNLEQKLTHSPIAGCVGIGHTRWATHGAPIETNAHPHMNEFVAVVHNGIIENFSELKASLQSQGCIFETDTDTEVLVHLITAQLKQNIKPKEAVIEVVKVLRGAFAIAAIFKNCDNMLIAVRQGPPLAIGYGEAEHFVGSDAIALAPFTNKISYLEDGDIAIVTTQDVQVFDGERKEVSRKVTQSDVAAFMISKGHYRHFMQKEMYEQAESVAHTMSYYIDFYTSTIKTTGDVPANIAGKTAASAPGDVPDWKAIEHITFSGCGTAFYAGLVAKYWFEKYAAISVDNDVASEFRYRDIVFRKNTLAVFVSQSGETADSLASLRYCKAKNAPTLSVVNVAGSSMARESDFVFPTLCGPEIGVASTKAFTSQLTVLLIMAITAGYERGVINEAGLKEALHSLEELPAFINQTLKCDSSIKQFCKELAQSNNVLYLGRGTSFPIALEGALKLKELSYIHAEGYAAGELKHGPIALIDEYVPTIVVAPCDQWFEKTMSNVQEVAARGGPLLLLTDENGAAHSLLPNSEAIIVPTVPQMISPIVYAIPTQLIAYHTAIFLGTDVDQPRNLAKSVTVE